MTATAKISFAFAALLALSGVFGFWVGNSPASLFSGLVLGSLVAGFALAGHKGWNQAWLGSLALAVVLTGYLAVRAAESGSYLAGAMALAGLVTALALRAPAAPAAKVEARPRAETAARG